MKNKPINKMTPAEILAYLLKRAAKLGTNQGPILMPLPIKK